MRVSRHPSLNTAMGADRSRPALGSGLDPICDGAAADLRLRLREAMARRGAEFGEFAAHHRLVHLLAPDPWLPVLRGDLAIVFAAAVYTAVLAGPPDHRDDGRSQLGA